MVRETYFQAFILSLIYSLFTFLEKTPENDSNAGLQYNCPFCDEQLNTLQVIINHNCPAKAEYEKYKKSKKSSQKKTR